MVWPGRIRVRNAESATASVEVGEHELYEVRARRRPALLGRLPAGAVALWRCAGRGWVEAGTFVLLSLSVLICSSQLVASLLIIAPALADSRSLPAPAAAELPQMKCSARSADARAEAATGQLAMVAAAHPAAAEAGCAALAAGGSAADAAVAVQAVLAVVEPQSSGLAGGTIMLYYDRQQSGLHFFDGLARAPAEVTADLRTPTVHEATAEGVARFGPQVAATGRAVGVPGTVALLDVVHRRFGRLPFGRLLDVSIALAEQGFPMPPYLHRVLKEQAHGRDRCAYPDVGRRFCAHGRPLAVGEKITRPELALVLRLLRDSGARQFYDPAGPIVRGLVERARRGALVYEPTGAEPTNIPSLISAADIARYRVVEREPLCRQVLGQQVCTAGPPSFGGLSVLSQLGLLQRAQVGATRPGSVARAHLLLEASRFSLPDRSRFAGDPDFGVIPVVGLLAPQTLDRRFSDFSLHHALHPVSAASSETLAELQVARGDAGSSPADMTSHVSIVDGEGNAVSMTTTINSTFGAHMLALGMPLNNAQANFTHGDTLAPGLEINGMVGDKRPRTSMAPTMVFAPDRAELRLVVGGAGGSAIPDYVIQVLIGTLVDGLDPQQAMNLGHVSGQRFLDDCGGMVDASSEVERGSELELLAADLQGLGHPCVIRSELNSGLSAVQRFADGRLLGAADRRRDGIAVGD